MKLSFHLECVPPTATCQQKGVSVRGRKPHFYTKSNVRAAREQLSSLLTPHRPKTPLQGPLRLSMVWSFPLRVKDEKTYVGIPIPKDTDPDLDNVAKLAIDVMAKLRFFENDAQVASLYLSKEWADVTGIAIELMEFNEIDERII